MITDTVLDTTQLLSDHGRSVDLASNNQQRHEAAMLKIIGDI